MEVIIDNEKVKVIRLILGEWDTNAYVVVCRQVNKSVLIDAPAGVDKAIFPLADWPLEYILLTHTHIDHILGLPTIREKISAPLALHPLDIQTLPKVIPDKPLSDGETIRLGNVDIETLHTPGHTPGSLCFRVDNFLFSGDTLFSSGPGKTSRPDEFKQIVKSITEKIFILPDETLIFPGHGESTFIVKEKAEYAVFASRPHDTGLCGDVVWLSS